MPARLPNLVGHHKWSTGRSPHTSSALATRGKLADITDNRDSNRLARLDGATCERRTVKYHRALAALSAS
jgi:hypothetical protein